MSYNRKTVARLVKESQSIQKQMDRLASDLRDLNIKIKEEENSSKKLQVGVLVMITSRDRNGTRCVVDSFTAQRVSVITVDANENYVERTLI